MDDFYTRIELADKLAKACGKSGLNASIDGAYYIDTSDFGFSKKFGNNSYSDFYPSVIAATQPRYTKTGWYGMRGKRYQGVKDGEPCALLVCDFNILNLSFMREGTLKASSTYLRLPIATSLYTSSRLTFFTALEDSDFRDDFPIKILRTKEEIDEWFDEILPAEIDIMRTQENELAEALKKINTEGKHYKDIIKQYGKSSTQGKEARAAYENMIIAIMNRLTKRESIKKSARMFET